MKRPTILGLFLLMAFAIGGCGSDSNATASEEAGFKDHSATNLPKPPPGAMEKATDVQSSLGGKSGPSNVKPPTSGPGG